MKILILSTSSNNTATFIGSLEVIEPKPDLRVFYYDQKWHQAALAAMQQNKEVETLLRQGAWKVPRERVSSDNEILAEARANTPDLIVYISAWEGQFVPLDETLGELNTMAPLVHFLCDGADPPWWPQLERFEEKGIFSLTVNIDGSHDWPGGKGWFDGVTPHGYKQYRIKSALTLLTPCDPRPFEGAPFPPPFLERPYAMGYAGNPGNHPRVALIEALQKRGYAYRQRDDQPGSYKNYTHFLRHCRTVVSVPFTGSGAARHVKGRVLEAGWAGCALLEWKNDATASWFTPRYEFEEYGSIEEALDLAEMMARTPRRTRDIARALAHRVTTEHSPQKFWDKVFERAGK